tara:strand:- start:415 stop:699 length:285 start_codon:yes stop_codon:yes gene_type:complete
MNIDTDAFTKQLNTKARLPNQELPEQNKIFKYKTIQNAGKAKPLTEKDIFEFDDKPIKKTVKTKPKVKVAKSKDIFEPSESIGTHNKANFKKKY